MDPVVNLELVTAAPTVDVGSLVEVQLLARAADSQDIPIVAVQALLNWDSDVLRLAGVIDNVTPDYEWFLSGFFNDIGTDNLNDGVTTAPMGLPFNDGDASFEALGQFPPAAWPVARPAGTRITTFVFEALRASSPTKIDIPLSAGEITTSAVFWGEGAPGVDILGDTSNVLITVTPEPSTLAMVMLGLAGSCRGRVRRGLRTK